MRGYSATPVSSVGASSGSSLPSVVEKLTMVPGLTGEPLSLRTMAVTVAFPAVSLRVGLTLRVIVVPAGATGLALSQAGVITRPATRRAQRRSRVFTSSPVYE